MPTSAEPTFDAVTRIAAGDDGTNYDRVAIALHWLTALLVVANFQTAMGVPETGMDATSQRLPKSTALG